MNDLQLVGRFLLVFKFKIRVLTYTSDHTLMIQSCIALHDGEVQKTPLMCVMLWDSGWVESQVSNLRKEDMQLCYHLK